MFSFYLLKLGIFRPWFETNPVGIHTCRFKVNLGCYHFGFNQYFFWVSNHWFWNGKNWPGSNLRFFRVQNAVLLNSDLKWQSWIWKNNWFEQTWIFSRFKINLELKIPDFWFTLNWQLSHCNCMSTPASLHGTGSLLFTWWHNGCHFHPLEILSTRPFF